MTRPNGVVLWESDTVVAIATGLARASANRKTGPMIQTWILRRDRSPVEAVKTGADSSICGDCPLRGNGSGGERACYVNVGQAPQAVWRAYRAGAYSRDWDAETFRGERVRLGAYGDPAMVPVSIWKRALRHAAGWTGYTHQWRRLGPAWSRLIMASCDSLADADRARRKGWRAFTVLPAGSERPAEHVWCPASPEGGERASCASCGLCAGTSKGRAKSVAILAHGSGSKYVTLGRTA